MGFAKGIPQTELAIQKAGPTATRGTTVLFKPDSSIFKTTVDFEFDKLASRIDELAYLNAGLTINLIDRRTKKMRQKQALVKSQTEDDEGVIPSSVDEVRPKFAIIASHGTSSPSLPSYVYYVYVMSCHLTSRYYLAL